MHMTCPFVRHSLHSPLLDLIEVPTRMFFFEEQERYLIFLIPPVTQGRKISGTLNALPEVVNAVICISM
jgi:hypothetical protein